MTIGPEAFFSNFVALKFFSLSTGLPMQPIHYQLNKIIFSNNFKTKGI